MLKNKYENEIREIEYINISYEYIPDFFLKKIKDRPRAKAIDNISDWNEFHGGLLFGNKYANDNKRKIIIFIEKRGLSPLYLN